MEGLVGEISANDSKSLGINYMSQDLSDDSSSGITMNTAGTFYAGESYARQRDSGRHGYARDWL